MQAVENEKKNYEKTIRLIEANMDEIIEEIFLFQKNQTALLGNDFYMIKGGDTQAIFERVLCKNQAKIAPNNHQKGYDIKHAGNQISIKSGTVANHLLKFSYSRTTEQVTLEDKINYLSTFENLILGIATEKVKSSNPKVVNKLRYYLYYFPANQIDLRQMEWTETPNQILGVDTEKNINVDIKRKMSDQPWITVPTDLVQCKLLATSSLSISNGRKYLTLAKADTREKEHYDVYSYRKQLTQLIGMKKCSTSTTKAVMA